MEQAYFLNKITIVLFLSVKQREVYPMMDMTQSLPEYIGSMTRYMSGAQPSPSLQPPEG